MNCIYMFQLFNYSIYPHGNLVKEAMKLLVFPFQGKVTAEHQDYMICSMSHSMLVHLRRPSTFPGNLGIWQFII